MKRILVNSILLLFMISSSCNRNPYATTNKQYKKSAKLLAKQLRQPPSEQLIATAPDWVGTTNFNLRKPNLVIIHHTAQNSCDQTLKTFTMPKTNVSAHYVICKEGVIQHMLNDYLRAWHGGIGKWGTINDINSTSIGIEIDNNGIDTFTTAQMNSLLIVLDSLKKRYAIPTANFIGHSDIAPTRKVDPNIHFPWKQLADKGFGHWWNDTTGVIVPTYFNHKEALRLIGYDVIDSSAAFGAFNRKYLQLESRIMAEPSRKVLYQLYQKYL